MGALSDVGASIGQMFGGQATAQATAQRSLGWGALATGLDATGDILSGVGQLQASQFAAGQLGREAGDVRAAGQYAESAKKVEGTRTVAAQKVAFAANGVDLGSSSVRSVEGATERVNAMDAAMIHYNAAREAYGLEAQAALTKRAGRNAVTGALFKAGTTLLGGANSLSDKWLAYQRSGAV